MTWRGRQTALPIRADDIDALRAYIRGLNYSSWRPSGMCVHNTASPTLEQWWHGGTSPEQRMKNLRSYYENEMGWSAGPHAFVDGVTWWIFTDFNVKGVHSPSYNGTRLGIELVGDYAKESDETGAGAKVMEMGIALFGECCTYFGWEPNNDKIKFHKEDPATTHDCPGKNIVKSEFLTDVTNYMSDGGDHGQEPEEPRLGTVYGLVPNDFLNIRAEASSSSPVIGKANNGDEFTVVGSAMNGTTKWLRIQIGSNEGPGLALFGWASAAYIDVEGEEHPEDETRDNITATVFGNPGDEQDSAYPDIDWITSKTKGVALPYKWKETPRPRVIVTGPSGETTADIVDLGPWNTNDPLYVLEGQRPLAEKQHEQQTPAQNGQIPVNDAGIDLTVPVAKAVGISGKGKVSWRFA